MTPQSRVKNSHFLDFVEAGRNPGNLEVPFAPQAVNRALAKYCFRRRMLLAYCDHLRLAERNRKTDSSVSLIYAHRKIPFTLISTPMRRFSHRHIGRGIVFRTHNLDPASAVGVDHGRNFGARARIRTRRQYHVIVGV
jgi:hypothetical protein